MHRCYSSADVLRDINNNGVARQSSQPGGKPISTRNNLGTLSPGTCPSSSAILAYAGHRRMYGAKWFAVAVGVGHNEDSVPVVRIPELSGGQSQRHAGVPAALQVAPHDGHPFSPVTPDILYHHP
jgi:hypothetical protein